LMNISKAELVEATRKTNRKRINHPTQCTFPRIFRQGRARPVRTKHCRRKSCRHDASSGRWSALSEDSETTEAFEESGQEEEIGMSTAAASPVEASLHEIERLRQLLKKSRGKQVRTSDEKTLAKAVATTWFSTHRRYFTASDVPAS